MSTFILYPENGIECVICGDDINSAIENNMDALQYYIGAQSEILSVDIDKVSAEYRVRVRYLWYNGNRKSGREEKELVVWCKEIDEYKI